MGLKIELEWQKPIQLTLRKRLVDKAEAIAEAVEKQKVGVYVFSRKHGSRLLPFYIGRSQRLRGRLIDHLKKNVQLMKVIEGYGDEAAEVGQGTRFFQYAFLIGPKYNAKGKLEIVERALIRKAIADGFFLLNTNNTIINTHTVLSRGPGAYRAVFDRTTNVESQD